MNDEEVAVRLNSLDHEAKSAKHRLNNLEIQNKALQELVLSVRELTINMGIMMEEQKRQGCDIERMKAEPGNNWSNMKNTIFNTIVGAGAGAIATGIFYILAQNIR